MPSRILSIRPALLRRHHARTTPAVRIRRWRNVTSRAPQVRRVASLIPLAVPALLAKGAQRIVASRRRVAVSGKPCTAPRAGQMFRGKAKAVVVAGGGDAVIAGMNASTDELLVALHGDVGQSEFITDVIRDVKASWMRSAAVGVSALVMQGAAACAGVAVDFDLAATIIEGAIDAASIGRHTLASILDGSLRCRFRATEPWIRAGRIAARAAGGALLGPIGAWAEILVAPSMWRLAGEISLSDFDPKHVPSYVQWLLRHFAGARMNLVALARDVLRECAADTVTRLQQALVDHGRAVSNAIQATLGRLLDASDRLVRRWLRTSASSVWGPPGTMHVLTGGSSASG